MRILLIRHGKAGDREEFARRSNESDENRPLTEEGQLEMERISQSIAQLYPDLNRIYSSRLTRAKQTAQIICNALSVKGYTEISELHPAASGESFLTFLRNNRFSNNATIAFVGHEPHLTGLASMMVSRDDDAQFILKKGGLICLRLEDAGSKSPLADLEALLMPKHLRNLSE